MPDARNNLMLIVYWIARYICHDAGTKEIRWNWEFSKSLEPKEQKTYILWWLEIILWQMQRSPSHGWASLKIPTKPIIKEHIKIMVKSNNVKQ